MKRADPTMTRYRVMERVGSSYSRNEHDDHCWIVFAGITRKIIRIWPDKTIEAIHLEHYTGVVWHTLIDMSTFDAPHYCELAAKMLEEYFDEEIRRSGD